MKKGSSGAVGSATMQLVRNLGATPVPSGRTVKDETTLDITKDSFTSDIERITNGKGVSVICDTVVDPALFQKAFAALSSGGR